MAKGDDNSMSFTDEERERNGKRFGETGWIEI